MCAPGDMPKNVYSSCVHNSCKEKTTQISLRIDRINSVYSDGIVYSTENEQTTAVCRLMNGSLKPKVRLNKQDQRKFKYNFKTIKIKIYYLRFQM